MHFMDLPFYNKILVSKGKLDLLRDSVNQTFRNIIEAKIYLYVVYYLNKYHKSWYFNDQNKIFILFELLITCF